MIRALLALCAVLLAGIAWRRPRRLADPADEIAQGIFHASQVQAGVNRRQPLLERRRHAVG
ncbi:MAG: hypothetical protein ABF479_20595, partial [Gluconacetobacter sp.]